MANRTLSFSELSDLVTPRWTPNASDVVTKAPITNCSSVPMDSIQPREDSWVIPLVVLSTLNITAILFFEVYVLYKSCGSRRHLFLGQVLLLGLFLSSSLGFAFVPDPHWLTCALTRAGIGLAYVLVFGTLLVKCVFLLSLHVGVYLSAVYQGLLLFFVVAVQVVISVQWLVYRPPQVVVAGDGHHPCYFTCATSPSDMIVSLVYSMLLMIGVAVLAIRARTVPENHGESLYIGTAIGLTIPLWMAWILVSLVADSRHHDACIAFGVVITASVMFLVVFLPKGRQLAAMGRDGIYTEDGFSSVNQSIYTPSFLHLKPPMLPLVKQGTLVKPLTSTFPSYPGERGFFMPTHPSRLWRYTHPATLQLPPLHPPDDLYFASERYFFSPPGIKVYRSPMY